MSTFHVKNLNLLLPKDGIEEKMIPHTDLILPRPWNPLERKDLGSRVWVRKGEGESSSSGSTRWGGKELVRERESGLNEVGPLKTAGSGSTGQTGFTDRSDRSGPG